MAESKPPTIATELLAGNFAKNGPHVTELSDPLVDTPMVVNIDQLKPYDHNPRIIRNPLYEDIKASIRERGLDAPPAITRRPGESHFIIRNGGNTRLSILRELWSETKQERFFKIHCLFRPWQSEITALTGHLVENELHGQLSFIERALAIQKLNEFYQKEQNNFLSQRQLAKKISEDGYPVSQSQISLMQDTVNYLLPIIPNALYSGLSRRQIKSILNLRKSAKSIWETYTKSSEQTIIYTFDDLFGEVLSLFDNQASEIDSNRFQDELIGRMAEIFNCSYNLIALEFTEKDSRRRMLELPPSPDMEIDEAFLFAKPCIGQKPIAEMDEKEILAIPMPVVKKPTVTVTRTSHIKTATVDNNQSVTSQEEYPTDNVQDISNTNDWQELQAIQNTQKIQTEQLINEHIVSPIETTPRLAAIQEMIAEFTGEDEPDFKTTVIKAIPVQAGGLYPIADLWYISHNLDNLAQLRIHIGQLVLEIAEEFGLTQAIETNDAHLGFTVNALSGDSNKTAQVITYWLSILSGNPSVISLTNNELMIAQASLLTGLYHVSSEVNVLSDVAFVKLMRILRLIRRFCELQAIPEDITTVEADNR